jgi:hypothetical protein
MSGCALFPLPSRIQVVAGFARSRVEMALKDRWKFCRGLRSRGALQVCMSGALENYVACLARTLSGQPAIYG